MRAHSNRFAKLGQIALTRGEPWKKLMLIKSARAWMCVNPNALAAMRAIYTKKK